MNDGKRRIIAIAATRDRYSGRVFGWARAATCVHMLRFHAAQMGHRLPIVPRFRSALGARRALQAAGADTVPQLLDTLFPAIPPAFMRPGDVLAGPGSDGFEALYIKCDKAKFLGFHQDTGTCTIIDIDPAEIAQATGAWRL